MDCVGGLKRTLKERSAWASRSPKRATDCDDQPVDFAPIPVIQLSGQGLESGHCETKRAGNVRRRMTQELSSQLAWSHINAAGATKSLTQFADCVNVDRERPVHETVRAMRHTPSPTVLCFVMAAAAVTSSAAGAARLKTIYTFTGGADGAEPYNALIAGPQGSLIGNTAYGGTASAPAGWGTVFQLLPPANGQSSWTLSTLYAFTDQADGASPGGMVSDTSGAVYGTAQQGGTFNGNCIVSNGADYGCGTVFKLTPPGGGQSAWQYSVLYAFNGSGDGYLPGGLAIDATGALYGVTSLGGTTGQNCPVGCGTVFKLTPPAMGQNVWTKTILYAFQSDADGDYPNGQLLLSGGNIFGNTFLGGAMSKACTGFSNGCGLVFELIPPAKGKTAWTKKTILAFKGHNGSYPGYEGLAMDAAGNLFGSTELGGKLNACVDGAYEGCGVAYELTPPPKGDKAWTDTVIYAFKNGRDGSAPVGPPVPFSSNDYMTTSGDEVKTFGSIVELVPPGNGHTAWTEKPVFVFTGDQNGGAPYGTLLPQGSALYGSTAGIGSGPAPWGTIFEFQP